ncbi:MAG: alpha/beta fold hydrolase [Dehalococcoidia bacterium]
MKLAQSAERQSPKVVYETPRMDAARPDWILPERRDIDVDGHRIRYWEKGGGRPLVLVHGFSGNAPFEWGRVFDALAGDFRVVAPQVLGFAPSAQPDVPYTTDALVTALGNFISALDLEDVVLVGESFGGWLVGSYAVRAASLGLPVPAKLVIVGGPIGEMSGVRANAEGFVHQAVKDEVAAWFETQEVFDNEPLKARISKESGLRKGELSLEAATTIAVPTLLVWGEQDELIPLRVGLAGVEAIPDARLHVFRDVGHIPSVECPNEFARVLGAFSRD